ncbi:MAG: MFS transporter [Lentisphaeria bacterium]|nr:MAG: MFS transporter [Lentisphaeria bacterium]
MGAAAAVRYSWRRNLAIIWISQFLSMASFSSAYTFMPFYFSSLGVPDDELSMYVALFNVAGNLTFCIFAPIWGMVADVYGRRMMLLRANFGAAVMLPLMALVNSPEWLILLRLGIGALTGTVAAAQTLLISTTPKEHRSFALGTIASALFGGMMAGQFLGGDYVMLFDFIPRFLPAGDCFS